MPWLLFAQPFYSKCEIISKGKGVDTCCSATYMSQTRDQQRFTISEVAADWQEPTISSIARENEQLDPRCSTQTYHRPN